MRNAPSDGGSSGGRDGPGSSSGRLLASLAVPDSDSGALNGVLRGQRNESCQRAVTLFPEMQALCAPLAPSPQVASPIRAEPSIGIGLTFPQKVQL